MDNALIFTIDGFTPGTMPMSRLAQYLEALSNLYGNKTQVHFESVSTGSLVLRTAFDTPDLLRSTQEKCNSLARGQGSVADLKLYRKVNDLLREDSTSASQMPDVPHDAVDRKVVEFPGAKSPKPEDSVPFKQPGSIQGEIILIGGKDASIPVWLRERGGDVIKGISVNKVLALELAPLLFKFVRLNGEGKWQRTAEGEWKMNSFVAHSFDMLNDDSLHDVIARARSIPGNEWGSLDDPFDYLNKLRD